MLLRKQFLLRVTALFLAFNMLTQIVWPTMVYALTAGPTVPEATSFEPVDTTDMVNPMSGDFNYNIPLIEVPGPEGGYPLSLSYHAGIQPDEEASWVGLGWSLNPGAITRNVNGYADDHENVNNVIRDYWSGGNTETYKVGVSVGIANSPASVSFGLSFSQDTYQGFGLGANMGVGMRIGGENSPVGIGFTIGDDGYGNAYAGASAGVGIPLSKGSTSLNLGLGVGLTTNFESVDATAGAGLSVSSKVRDGGSTQNNFMSHSLLGASISSGGSKPSLSVGGGSRSVHNAIAGKISTSSSSWGVDFPVYPGVSVSLGYSYVRYWSDEKYTVSTSGALYYPKTAIYNQFDSKAYDTYTIHQTDLGLADNTDPEKLLGGSFPDYDNYTVMAQGVSGSIRPYMYKGSLYRQNRKNKDNVYEIKHFGGGSNFPVEYRFINDFSNSFMQGHPDYSYSTVVPESKFDNALVHVYEGYNNTTNHLAGSKHIEWFSNTEIANGTARAAGFINNTAAGFLRKNDSQVGGFMITNESGVTYHFALPAYSFNEYIRTQNLDTSISLSYNELTKRNPYAYTWYLTAITGPDYVDRGILGVLDPEDWGYWTKFDYGKWADNYKWRNPAEGYHRDVDAKFGSYSSGEKEIYYLNAVSTRTHTAIFEKEIRADGKGIVEHMNSLNSRGFKPYYSYLKTESVPAQCEPGIDPECQDYGYAYFTYPTASMRLNKIHLLKNEDVPQNLAQLSTSYNHTFTYSDGYRTSQTDIVHRGSNVIDKHDIAVAGQAMKSKAIRIIDFSYDYSLAPETLNSFDANGEIYSYSFNETIPEKKLGKLTLKEVQFQGVGGAELLPGTKFAYDLPAKSINAAIGKLATGAIWYAKPNNAAEAFQSGQIIHFENGGKNFYAVLTKETSVGSGEYILKFVGENTPAFSSLSSVNVRLTKNPPYRKGYSDQWGMYKADYNENPQDYRVNTRYTSLISSQSVDAWSLREIQNPLGAKIKVDYSSDSYRKAELSNTNFFVNLEPVDYNENMFKLKYFDGDIKEAFKVGDQILINGVIELIGSGDKMACPSVVVYRESIKAEVLSIYGNDQLYLKDNENAFTGDVVTPCGIRTRSLAYGYIAKNQANKVTLGGGIKVDKIAVSSGGKVYNTHYTYNYHDNANLTSGVTSYAPNQIEEIFVDSGNLSTAVQEYKNSYYKGFSDLLPIARELPGPGVMYEYVTVQQTIEDGNGNAFSPTGKTLYQFEVFNRNMVGIEEFNRAEGAGTSSGTDPFATYKTRNLAIKNFTTRIGNLKRVVNYGSDGNKIQETVTNYLHDGISQSNFKYQADQYTSRLGRFDYQGVVQERFSDARRVRRKDGLYDLLMVMSKREDYPTINTGSTLINYKTGIRETTENLAFDYFSGQVTKVLSKDSYGNHFVTETEPAYKFYQAMGLKVRTPGNKHMLIQEARSTTYRVTAAYKQAPTNPDNIKGIVSSTVQTWDNKQDVLGLGTANPDQNKIWRKKATYFWSPGGAYTDGLTPKGNFNAFKFNLSPEESSIQNSSWTKAGEVTLYDAFSHALEVSDINEAFAASKMDHHNKKILISATPARYHEIAFSGAEESVVGGAFSGGVLRGTGNVSSAAAHTGKNSVLTTGQQTAFVYKANVATTANGLKVNKAYFLNVWAKGSVDNARLYYSLNGGSRVLSAAPAKRAGDWYLVSLVIPASALTSGASIEIGCLNLGTAGIYFDDFRLQPVNASAISYVYDNHTGQVSHIMDNNNLFTRFEYDAAGRLVKTYRETLEHGGEKLVAQNQYHYAMLNSSAMAAINAASADASPGSAKTAQVRLTGLPNAFAPYKVTLDPGGRGAVTGVSVVQSVSAYTGNLSATSSPYSLVFTAPNEDANPHSPFSTFSLAYQNGGTYWIKVRVEDAMGNHREMVQKVVVQN